MRQIQHKFFTLIAAMLVAAMVLTGCTSESTQEPTQPSLSPTEKPTEEPTQLPPTPTEEPIEPTSMPTMMHETTPAPIESADKIDPVTFHMVMRNLWEDHAFWTRMYIMSAVSDLPDAGLTAERLLQNQVDMGNAVATFYGEEAGAALTELLQQHILTAADLVGAAKAGDQDAVTTASNAWYANADEISAFLASANPAWPEDVLQEMMTTHLDQTLAEATAQLTGDYAGSIAEYDHIVTHIQAMADALSAGIIAQFPDQFE